MQPLYSVDHESRNSTNHGEDQVEIASPTENSPLLQRFPENLTPRNPLTTLTISLLLLILIAGVLIGIYLLVLQNSSENILPPVELPLQLVSRSQWDQTNLFQTAQYFMPYRVKDVMVVHTNSQECISTETCSRLLQDMQAKAASANNTIPYNFLISSNGQTYEALGWHKPSPMLTSKSSKGLVLSFIGNFSRTSPSRLQIEEAKNFFAESISHQYLHSSYRIIGKNTNDTPAYLRQSLKEFPQWNNEFFDSENNRT